jgi:uncharacterized membrane protein YccC
MKLNFGSTARRILLWCGKRGPEARLALRVTVAGLLAFTIGRVLGLAQGYWAVFTAVIVMQGSLGGSFIAAIDYFIGTLAGAIYGTAVALVLPIHNVYELGLALAVSLAPLSFLAAIRRDFRVAPITAVIVLIIPALQHSNAFASAVGRVIEIAIGSGTGIVVSLLVFPARANRIVADTAADVLRLSIRLVSLLFAGFAEKRDLSAIVRLQDGYRRLLVKLDGVVTEAARERASLLTHQPDTAPLLRTLRRLRFDYAIIGRAAASPLPDAVRPLLLPPLQRLSSALVEFVGGAGRALGERRPPPSMAALTEAFGAYAAAMTEARGAGLTRDLPDDEVARIFALGFALDQLRRNLGDLDRRVAELARAK